MIAKRKLHKASKMKGLHIQATDGTVGHVDELLFDEGMTIQFLAVDTSNLPGGKSVLVPSRLVDSIDSPDGRVHVRLTREQLGQCPPLEAADIELVETLKPTLI